MADLYMQTCSRCGEGPTDCLVHEDGFICIACFERPVVTDDKVVKGKTASGNTADVKDFINERNKKDIELVQPFINAMLKWNKKYSKKDEAELEGNWMP